MNGEERRYLFFYVKNYTGMYSTSGYTLSISPFTFIPILDDAISNNVSHTNLYWDFGDGTTSRDITATHYYKVPGMYDVSCYFLTNSGVGFESVYKQSICVYDFFSDTLMLSANTDTVNTASHIDTTLLISRINSWQSYNIENTYSITLEVSGEGAPLVDVEKYKKDKFAHLKPSSRFLAYEYNTATNNYELIPVNSISTNTVFLYAKLSGSIIVPCLSSDTGSTFAGTSGQRIFYFTDDAPGGNVSVVAYFNSLIFKDRDNQHIDYPKSLYPILHQSNTTTYLLNFNNNQTPHHLSITSNGIDGEQLNTTSFNISPEKYINQPISFIVKVKDSSSYTIKSVDLLDLVSDITPLTNNKLHVRLVDELGNTLQGASVSSNFGILSSESVGGYFRGLISSNVPRSNVRIFAESLVNGVLVTGTSTLFSIYSSSVYSVGKINENFDASRQIQSYVFQESLQDYHRLFNDFIGTAVGNIQSEPTYLGKKVYERIANFVNNIASVDTCNIEALRSMHNMFSEDFYAFHRFNFNYPAEIHRLVEIFSIKFSKLKGGRNKYNKYFENKGYSNADVKYGKNLGKELDLLTTVLTAGVNSKPIVAYEKFSEQYTLLNTNILSSAYTSFINPSLMTYSLSAFNKWWGWELVLPDTYTIYDIQKYYKFYEYVDGIDNTQLEGIINWSDTLTTIEESLSSIDRWNEIRESMFSYALIKAMILTSS